ncbi:MAG: YlmC/YmxH family sporulation protein [Clostridia bacterium]|nr:YlmC/YmxH family sporulation protein [Clostridia bacterium]
MSFSELKRKDVINILDGKRLGKPIDIIFDEKACIESIVTPAPCTVLGLFSRDREGIVIPYCRIRRIGDDVILVEVDAGAYE